MGAGRLLGVAAGSGPAAGSCAFRRRGVAACLGLTRAPRGWTRDGGGTGADPTARNGGAGPGAFKAGRGPETTTDDRKPDRPLKAKKG